MQGNQIKQLAQLIAIAMHNLASEENQNQLQDESYDQISEQFQQHSQVKSPAQNQPQSNQESALPKTCSQNDSLADQILFQNDQPLKKFKIVKLKNQNSQVKEKSTRQTSIQHFITKKTKNQAKPPKSKDPKRQRKQTKKQEKMDDKQTQCSNCDIPAQVNSISIQCELEPMIIECSCAQDKQIFSQQEDLQTAQIAIDQKCQTDNKISNSNNDAQTQTQPDMVEVNVQCDIQKESDNINIGFSVEQKIQVNKIQMLLIY